MAEFVRVASVDEVPQGQGKLIEVGERFIALFNVKGEFYAVDDECTHAEASLSDGFVDGCAVECPLHGGKFDLRSGQALWSPAIIPVACYDVRVEGDDVLLNPEPRQ